MQPTFSSPVQNPELFNVATKWFVTLPHCKALNIEFVQAERGKVMAYLPFAEHLVGDAKARIVHGGVMTTLIDTTCGLTVFSLLDEPELIATLDLRIDYLRAATPDLPIYCIAECYRMSRQIAFLRATTYHDDPSQPIAYSVSTFMRTPIKKEEEAL
jgi:uncharacterized protein (TIGR00369 family)